jgi:hypothetical protein
LRNNSLDTLRGDARDDYVEHMLMPVADTQGVFQQLCIGSQHYAVYVWIERPIRRRYCPLRMNRATYTRPLRNPREI